MKAILPVAVSYFFALTTSMLKAQELKYTIVIASGDTIKANSLSSFSDDSLEVATETSRLRIYVDRIQLIILRENAWKPGAYTGGAFGVVGGIIYGISLGPVGGSSGGFSSGGLLLADFFVFPVRYSAKPLLYGTGFGVAGAAIGSLFGSQICTVEIFRLDQMSPEERRKAIKDLLE